MRESQSQSHVRWYCRYHVVWVDAITLPGICLAGNLTSW